MPATAIRFDPTADSGADAEALASLYAELIRFQNLKDMAGVLSCVHKESAGQMLIRQALEPFFDLFMLHYTLLDHVYVGQDGEYAYYRATVKVERIAGREFRDGVTENLVLYRQQQGEWKVWNRLFLSMVLV